MPVSTDAGKEKMGKVQPLCLAMDPAAVGGNRELQSKEIGAGQEWKEMQSSPQNMFTVEDLRLYKLYFKISEEKSSCFAFFPN